MTRITKPPEERRQEIIDTAMKVFYEKGYEKTSISDIAREMHVAQGLCYRYFSSKEELFDTALDQYATLQVQRLCANMRPDMSLSELAANAPSFLETENDDSYAEKFYHDSGNTKFHWQLSLKVCEKLQPIVADFLRAAIAVARFGWLIRTRLHPFLSTGSSASSWITRCRHRNASCAFADF